MNHDKREYRFTLRLSTEENACLEALAQSKQSSKSTALRSLLKKPFHISQRGSFHLLDSTTRIPLRLKKGIAHDSTTE